MNSIKPWSTSAAETTNDLSCITLIVLRIQSKITKHLTVLSHISILQMRKLRHNNMKQFGQR